MLSFLGPGLESQEEIIVLRFLDSWLEKAVLTPSCAKSWEVPQESEYGELFLLLLLLLLPPPTPPLLFGVGGWGKAGNQVRRAMSVTLFRKLRRCFQNSKRLRG